VIPPVSAATPAGLQRKSSPLVVQVGADVTVRLEIAADLPKGASDQVVRTVTENNGTLTFDTQGLDAHALCRRAQQHPGEVVC
jgi:hypothetical protein